MPDFDLPAGNKKIILIFLFLACVAIAAGYYVKVAADKNRGQQQKVSEENKNLLTERRYVLFVQDQKYEIAVPEGGTGLDLMKALKSRGDLNFSGQESDYGFFVDEINGLKNSTTDSTYWIYYINGQSASVGISAYILNEGDVVSWKYEKPQF